MLKLILHRIKRQYEKIYRYYSYKTKKMQEVKKTSGRNKPLLSIKNTSKATPMENAKIKNGWN